LHTSRGDLAARQQVVIANPKQVRIIAHAKVKTDTIDAGVLAQLYASGFLPEAWIPDQPTQALRRQVTRRNQSSGTDHALKISCNRSCTVI
jgi:transposase